MKRLLCAALLASAAAVPAQAAEPLDYVHVRVDETGFGVGSQVGRQPLFGARYDRTTGELCVGFSYQVPQCVGGPIN